VGDGDRATEPYRSALLRALSLGSSYRTNA
jgi:hypothetical protein